MRIDKVITSGLLDLVDPPVDIENNIWIVGDDDRVIVIDASHDAEAIIAAIDGRTVDMVACTHGHLDHINKATALADATGAPIALHPADRMLWERVYPERAPDIDFEHDMHLTMPGGVLTVLHTPGHTPGSVSFSAVGDLFGGDTLFQGGPGATGFEFGDFATIIESIKAHLFPLAPNTVVHPGHGPDTTIASESPNLSAWIEAGG